jgi:hypothetical protein
MRSYQISTVGIEPTTLHAPPRSELKEEVPTGTAVFLMRVGFPMPAGLKKDVVTVFMSENR